MKDMLLQSLFAAYFTVSLAMMTYGLHCYAMIVLFMRRQRRSRAAIQDEVRRFNEGRQPGEYPMVTIQLPIYNEADVIERLMRSLIALNYPRDRFEIQVLDDSTDHTREVVDRVAGELRNEGLAVEVVRRPNRRDFKAGALAYATPLAKGEFLAIFDADFVVPPSFLKRTMALFHGQPNVACVQTRWGHTNKFENWLTRAQSVGIDGHFSAEQGARSYNGLCMNFNGTAGVWRRSALEAGGGWEGDTLTEDLDLSYRVQLAGYRIRFDFDLECPAELPNNVVALKSQQRRWAKGSMEVACKLMPRIFAAPQLSFGQKLEAFLHLTHYAVAVMMSLLCMLTLPMLLWFNMPTPRLVVAMLWTVIILSAIAPCVMYTVSGFVLRRGMFSFMHFPTMVIAGTGLCLNNARAVLEALRGHKSEFVRTPKSGSTNERSRKASYAVSSSVWASVAEVLLGLYCLVTFAIYLHAHRYLFGLFMGAYGMGLVSFGLLSLRDQVLLPFWRARVPQCWGKTDVTPSA